MIMIQSEHFQKLKKCYFSVTESHVTESQITLFKNSSKTPQNIIFNPISLGTVFPGIIVSSKAMLKIIRWFYKKIWWF